MTVLVHKEGLEFESEVIVFVLFDGYSHFLAVADYFKRYRSFGCIVHIVQNVLYAVTVYSDQYIAFRDPFSVSRRIRDHAVYLYHKYSPVKS